jgi:hypothetical protein
MLCLTNGSGRENSGRSHPPNFGETLHAGMLGDLVVQRNDLAGSPQTFLPSPGVAGAGNAIPLLSPFGEGNYVALRLRWGFGGEYDLQ